MKHFYLILAAALLCSCNNFYQPVDPNTDVAGHQETNNLVPRFSYTINGLTVTVHDFSIGYYIYYEFGDNDGDYMGTTGDTFSHTYAKKGTYTIYGRVYDKNAENYEIGYQTIQVK